MPRLPPGAVILDSGREGPFVAVVAGIHGDEPSGPQTARVLAASAAPARGRILVLAEANPGALAAGSRTAPGGADLNRVFAGDSGAAGTEASRAAAILDALRDADLVLDLHEEGLAWAEADLPTLVLSPAAAGLGMELLEALAAARSPFAFTGGAPRGSLVGELGTRGRAAIAVEVPARLPSGERARLLGLVLETVLGLLGMR